MTKNRLADHVVAGAVTVLMLLWLWQATRLPYTADGRPGPGFFPMWLAAIGAVLGMSILVAGLRAARRPASEEPDDAEPEDTEPEDTEPEDAGSPWAGTLRLVGALAGAIAFLVLMPVLGFAIGLALYLAYLCLVIARLRVASALALSLGTAVTIYLLFDELLGVPFPPGLMGT